MQFLHLSYPASKISLCVHPPGPPSFHPSFSPCLPIPASNRPPISPLPSISSTLRPMHHPSLPTCKRPSISQSLSPNLPPFLNATLPPSLHPTIPPTIPSSHHPSIHLYIYTVAETRRRVWGTKNFLRTEISEFLNKISIFTPKISDDLL